jgi:hypothetical protein
MYALSSVEEQHPLDDMQSELSSVEAEQHPLFTCM